MPDTLPRRRLLLASATTVPLLLAAAGCRSSDLFTGADPLAGRPPPGHDVVILQAAIAAEENLISLYQAVIGRDPSVLLDSLLVQHEQHLTRLRAALIEPAGIPTAGPAASPGPAAGAGSGPGPRVPDRDAIARLRAAERTSAAAGVRRLATVTPALAQLFASIAASDATHVAALSALAR